MHHAAVFGVENHPGEIIHAQKSKFAVINQFQFIDIARCAPKLHRFARRGIPKNQGFIVSGDGKLVVGGKIRTKNLGKLLRTVIPVE